MSLSRSPRSGWIATVTFFSTNVGSAIVMLITTLLFTLVTLLMALVLIKVSETHAHTLSGVPTSHPEGFQPLLSSGAPPVPGRWGQHAARSGGVEHRRVEECPGEGGGLQRGGSVSPRTEPAPVPCLCTQLSRQQSLVMTRRCL